MDFIGVWRLSLSCQRLFCNPSLRAGGEVRVAKQDPAYDSHVRGGNSDQAFLGPQPAKTLTAFQFKRVLKFLYETSRTLLKS